MDTYKVKFTSLQLEILRLLCIRAGMQLNQREMAEELDVSPTAIGNSLGQLTKQKLITVTKNARMNLKLVQFNRDDSAALNYKKIENLKILYEYGLVGHLEELFPGTIIILFGSYSKGEDTVKSDIDIAIIGSSRSTHALAAFEKKLEREISLHTFHSFKNIAKELKNNILSGIVLAGSVEL